MRNNIWLICLLFGWFYLSIGQANAEKYDEIEQNIVQIEKLYSSDPDILPYQAVVDLSRRVIKNRQLYDNNTIAKVFILLADSAVNKGDLAKAMQFAQDGESLLGIEPSLRLSLLLKIASGYYFKGKYHDANLIADKAVTIAKELNQPVELIKALGYRAVTYAVIAMHQEAFVDLQQVQRLLTEYDEVNDRITLLNIIASANFYLGSYKTALALYNKVLKLRFDLDKKQNLDQTYYNIARCYLKLEQYDDAFHASDGAMKYAQQKDAPIRMAYAQSVMGQVLIKQSNYREAIVLLQHALQVFQGEHISQPYLMTLLNLAKAAKADGQQTAFYRYLQQAEKVIVTVELTQEQIEFYLLLSEMYQQQENYQVANQALNTYLVLFNRFYQSDQHAVDVLDPNEVASEKSRQLSLKLAAETELENQFKQKYQRQYDVIVGLAVVVVLMLILLLFQAYRMRVLRLNRQYDEIEKPTDFIATPSQTKSFYQHHYKMARKFEYPLVVGYFSIDNWQELEFQFSKRVTEEVSRTIAMLVNEHSSEFDQVGLINNGEYLFLSPYQTPEQLKKTFERLTKALKVQFFANLGEFSLKVSYDCQAPNVQDIDPYIFLSRLSESTRAEYSSYKS